MSTEAVMRDDILQVQSASVGNQIMHLSRCFKDAPAPRQAAVVVCYVTCSDKVAAEIHKRLDATVNEFFAECGVTLTLPPVQ